MREDACRRLNPRSAPGVDRVTWRTSKENVATNLETVHEQRVNDPYGLHPVGRRLIPTSQGTLRPLGRPALEDTIVAKAVARLLEAIDEQDVCDASSGVRPGRSPQQALHDGRQGRLGTRIGQVSDGEIRAVCDH